MSCDSNDGYVVTAGQWVIRTHVALKMCRMYFFYVRHVVQCSEIYLMRFYTET